MEKAWSVLEELGAVDPDGNLTALGRHIVSTSSFFSQISTLMIE